MFAMLKLYIIHLTYILPQYESTAKIHVLLRNNGITEVISKLTKDTVYMED